MKFSEWPYERADIQRAERELEQLMEDFRAADSGEEQFEVHRRYYALEGRVRTQEVIARVRFDGDMTNAFYEKEFWLRQSASYSGLLTHSPLF